MVDGEQNIIKAASVRDAVFVLFIEKMKCVDHDRQKEGLRKEKHDVKRDQFQVTEISVLDICGGVGGQKKSGKLRKHHGEKDTQHGQELAQNFPPVQEEHEKNNVDTGDRQPKRDVVCQWGIGQIAEKGIQAHDQRIVVTRRQLGREKHAEGTIEHRLLEEIHQQIGKYIQGRRRHGAEFLSNMAYVVMLRLYYTRI